MPIRIDPLILVLVAAGALAPASLAETEANTDPDRISLFAPDDGGTPRDRDRVRRVGPGEFHIQAAVQEGTDRSVLTHAVSRVDLVCRNAGTEPRPVTLHLELSDEGRRTNFEESAFGGMPLRDFLFIQSPGEAWRQVEGTTSGWTATVGFTALPGETKVGLSPWYTYGDYLRFIHSLPEHPHLGRTLLGTSDNGREHWELTITDPSVPADRKHSIYWHAREHAYETFSSFAMEGLVAYLSSDSAAEARRRYVIVLHPMTNVDGVAEGFEYRGGYDVPNPRGTATGRLTFETIDRLRPDFAVAWHNWISPRDRDVVFYTDSAGDRPSRRAWDLFTQRFPSPRSAGHRWNNETTPLQYNWHGRKLSDANVHQYAMKHYGTRVWGWEMPWWRHTVDDARRAGAAFGAAFLATLDETDAVAEVVEEARPAAAVVEVPRWDMHEFVLHGKSHVENPYRDAALVGEFTSPSRRTVVVEGFHDGGDVWRLRFAPEEEGEWTYRLRGEGVELSEHGRLVCTAPRSRGFIRVHPENPYAFAYADGTPFFPMGDTCYGLFDDSPVTPELRADYLKTRRAQRFNFVRMSVGHSRYQAADDPARYWAFGGTPERPDLDRMNPGFFRGFDELLRQMGDAGMNAEVLVLNLYRTPFTDPRLWTPERERLWIRCLTARYAAFPNVFLWTVSNEYELHPDGKYRLDNPSDPDWAKATARFIKQHDPYRHPVTVHPVVSASATSSSPKGAFDPPWRIGEFFGKGANVDVLSQQTGQHGEGTEWDEQLRCWRGDSATVVASVRADRRYGKPVLNTENGYEYLRGHPTGKQQVHHTDKVRRTAWRIVCAGGYVAAGFHGTIAHSDVWNRIDAPNHYTFVVKDEGAAAQLGALYDFFAPLPFWRMQPFDGVTGDGTVALADPGEVCVVYLPRGGRASVDLTGSDGAFTARWFNPRDGRWGEAFDVPGGGRADVVAADLHDWTLLLRRGRADPP